LPLPLVPFLYAVATLLDDAQPDPNCFEYCDLGRDTVQFPILVGLIGVWMAALIWRRHVAAMALALFVTALLTGLWGIASVGPALAGNVALLLQPALLAIGVALIVQDALLVAALRVEMNRAGETAIRSVSAELGHE